MDAVATVLTGALGALVTIVIFMVSMTKIIKHYKGDHEWRQREETLRLLRWGCDCAVSHDETTSELGLIVLLELTYWDGVKDQERALLRALTTFFVPAQDDPGDEDGEYIEARTEE